MVKGFLDPSGGTYGSPRTLADLRNDGWAVSKKTVEASMRRHNLVGRPKKKRRRKGMTKPGKTAPPVADLINRDFTAEWPNQKWFGDFKQIDTDESPVFLGSCLDLFARRMVGFALSDDHPTAELAKVAIKMAVAVRGGDVAGVIFHADRGSQASTPLARSLRPASGWGSPGRQAELGRHTTTPQPNLSSPPSNTNSAPGDASPPKPKHGGQSQPGLTRSATQEASQHERNESPIDYENTAAGNQTTAAVAKPAA